jgi:hypothetical protein
MDDARQSVDSCRRPQTIQVEHEFDLARFAEVTDAGFVRQNASEGYVWARDIYQRTQLFSAELFLSDSVQHEHTATHMLSRMTTSFYPTLCLHIPPAVERSVPILAPTIEQVNIGQAQFASIDCFSNIRSDEIDAPVQEHISMAEMEKKTFTIWHINYKHRYLDNLLGIREHCSRGRHTRVPERLPKLWEAK